jgi:hypothetical protein
MQTAEFASCEKAADQSTCEALTALAAAARVDLLVLGSYGRKGEKIDMLGSVSDYSLREAHSSVFVVRSTTATTDSQVSVGSQAWLPPGSCALLLSDLQGCAATLQPALNSGQRIAPWDAGVPVWHGRLPGISASVLQACISVSAGCGHG